MTQPTYDEAKEDDKYSYGTVLVETDMGVGTEDGYIPTNIEKIGENELLSIVQEDGPVKVHRRDISKINYKTEPTDG